MADSTLAALTAATSLDGDELLYLVDDPSGTPADRKVTAKLLSGMGVIAQTTLGSAAASISFTSIPATYSHLRVVMMVRSAVAGTDDRVLVRFNNDTAANYDWQRVYGLNATAGASATAGDTSIHVGSITGSTATAGLASYLDIIIPAYAQTSLHKGLVSTCHFSSANAAANLGVFIQGGKWRSTAAITRVDLIGWTANLDAGTTATLYGLRGT